MLGRVLWCHVLLLMNAMYCVWDASTIACLNIIDQQSQHAIYVQCWLWVFLVHYCALSVDGEDNVTCEFTLQFSLRPNCNHVYDEVCNCPSNSMCKSIGNIGKLGQVILTLQPVLRLLWYLNAYTYHCAYIVSLLPMHTSANACESHDAILLCVMDLSNPIWIIFKLFQVVTFNSWKVAATELVDFAETHSQHIGTHISKDVCRSWSPSKGQVGGYAGWNIVKGLCDSSIS